MIRLRPSHLAAVLLAACSPVEDNREVDAPVADTTPPAIAKATPADMARKVSVIQPLTVVFDEDVDPATVTAASVTLSYRTDDLVPFVTSNVFQPFGPGMPKAVVTGTVTYDEVSRTLRFVPKAPLPYGERMTLTITGLKDVAGNELTTTIVFTTAVNIALRSRPFNSIAQPNNYTTLLPNANGFISEHVEWGSHGADLVWFNTDDVAIRFWAQSYKPNDQLEREFEYEAGVDTVLHTADDVKLRAISYAYDADGNPVETAGHDDGQEGADLMFGTADDGISFILARKYNAMGLVESNIFFTSPGTIDTVWRNADDQCVQYQQSTYDATGRRVRIVLRGCGTDTLPFTPDDTFSRYSEYTYDANNAVTRTVTRNGPGPNATWLDSDDLVQSTETWTVDANGLSTEYRLYSGAGMTNNDITRLTKWTYDANNQPIEVTQYGPGLDTDLGTADDVVTSYLRTTYDALGNRVKSLSFDLGPDLAPYTGDDRLVLDVEFDTLH